MEGRRKKKSTKSTETKSTKVRSSTSRRSPSPEPIDRKFSKRTVVSNWTKYDDNPVNEDNEQLNAADFEQLLETPAATGGHFFFASEQSWTKTDKSDMKTLQLNITNIRDSLMTIPYYERQGYSMILFSDNEVERMRTEALVNKQQWWANIDKKEPNYLPTGAAESSSSSEISDDGLDELFDSKVSIKEQILGHIVEKVVEKPEATPKVVAQEERYKVTDVNYMGPDVDLEKSKAEFMNWLDAYLK